MSSSTAKFLEACVRGRINIMVSGRNRRRQDDDPERAVVVHPRRRTHHHDRGRGRAQAAAAARGPPRGSPAEHRGQGRRSRSATWSATPCGCGPTASSSVSVRGPEALDMLQAMNTGHDGSISTVHSNSPRDSLSSLETITLMAGMELSPRSVREQIASAIQLIVHQSRLKDGTRRITHVTEVAGMESDVITLQDLFVFDFSAGLDEEGQFSGRLKSTGLRPKFLDKLAERGVFLDAETFALEPEGGPMIGAIARIGFWSSARRPDRAGRPGGWRGLRAGLAPVRHRRAREEGPRDRDRAWRPSPAPRGSRCRRLRRARRAGSPTASRTSVAGSPNPVGSANGWTPSSRRPGSSVRSGEFVVLSVVAFLVGVVLGAALLRNPLLALLIAAICGFAPTVALRAALRKRTRADARAAPRRPHDHGELAAGGPQLHAVPRHGRAGRSRSRPRPSSSVWSPRSDWAAPPTTRWRPSPSASAARTSVGGPGRQHPA